jgi:predicted dehydrogenase
MITGHQRDDMAQIRLIGANGVIEIKRSAGPSVRIWAKGQVEWQEIPTSDGIDGQDAYALSVLDAIDALKTRREPELSSGRALQATELIFATYESSRRRGRIELPLEIEDSPYLAMLEGK